MRSCGTSRHRLSAHNRQTEFKGTSVQVDETERKSALRGRVGIGSDLGFAEKPNAERLARSVRYGEQNGSDQPRRTRAINESGLRPSWRVWGWSWGIQWVWKGTWLQAYPLASPSLSRH